MGFVELDDLQWASHGGGRGIREPCRRLWEGFEDRAIHPVHAARVSNNKGIENISVTPTNVAGQSASEKGGERSRVSLSSGELQGPGARSLAGQAGQAQGRGEHSVLGKPTGAGPSV